MLRPMQKKCSPAVNGTISLLCRVQFASQFCVDTGPGCNFTFLSCPPAFDGGSTFSQTPPFWKRGSKDWEEPHQGQLLSEVHSWRDTMFTLRSSSLSSCPIFIFFSLPASLLVQFLFWGPKMDSRYWSSGCFHWSPSSYPVVFIRFFLSHQKIHLGAEEIFGNWEASVLESSVFSLEVTKFPTSSLYKVGLPGPAGAKLRHPKYGSHCCSFSLEEELQQQTKGLVFQTADAKAVAAGIMYVFHISASNHFPYTFSYENKEFDDNNFWEDGQVKWGSTFWLRHRKAVHILKRRC